MIVYSINGGARRFILKNRQSMCYNMRKGGDMMTKSERKALIRKIGYVLRAASPTQLDTVWRYVKWVMFGVGE